MLITLSSDGEGTLRYELETASKAGRFIDLYVEMDSSVRELIIGMWIRPWNTRCGSWSQHQNRAGIGQMQRLANFGIVFGLCLSQANSPS
jgi:hypothetical protein